MLLVISIIHTILGIRMLPATGERNIEGDKATHNYHCGMLLQENSPNYTSPQGNTRTCTIILLKLLLLCKKACVTNFAQIHQPK